MSVHYSGGCACGAVRYDVSGELLFANMCQCRQCQRLTGTGHAVYLTVTSASAEIRGETSHWTSLGENGTIKQNIFCPACGSPLLLALPQMPDIFAVQVGSLDDPTTYQPEMVFWTDTGHAWDELPQGIQKFQKLPPSQQSEPTPESASSRA